MTYFQGAIGILKKLFKADAVMKVLLEMALSRKGRFTKNLFTQCLASEMDRPIQSRERV